MVAAVENLQVVEGKGTDKNLVISADQVTVAVDNILKKKKWTRLHQTNQQKMAVAREGTKDFLALEAIGGNVNSPIRVPPIESCLRSDSSLLQELGAGAARTASTFLKKKEQLLGKRPGCNEVLMQDTKLSLSGRMGQESDKKLREEDHGAQEVLEEEDRDDEVEATSLGAAGTLTGAKERTCQEP
jgi:hypothetical protein